MPHRKTHKSIRFKRGDIGVFTNRAENLGLNFSQYMTRAARFLDKIFHINPSDPKEFEAVLHEVVFKKRKPESGDLACG